ncbi:cell cycle progression 1 (predicted), isoform CRA_e, partial [Rattus norvegicus]
MSENSSDSDSSCGWTVINHEGSDIEIVNSATASDNGEPTPEYSSPDQEELQVLPEGHGGGESSANITSSVGETMLSLVRETKSATEVEETTSPEDNVYFGTTSDDSDIVTLEPPKLEEMGIQEVAIIKDDLNLGSSSSSQYTFCQPEPGMELLQQPTFDVLFNGFFSNAAFNFLNNFSETQEKFDKICYSVFLASMAELSVLSLTHHSVHVHRVYWGRN